MSLDSKVYWNSCKKYYRKEGYLHDVDFGNYSNDNKPRIRSEFNRLVRSSRLFCSIAENTIMYQHIRTGTNEWTGMDIMRSMRYESNLDDSDKKRVLLIYSVHKFDKREREEYVTTYPFSLPQTISIHLREQCPLLVVPSGLLLKIL